MDSSAAGSRTGTRTGESPTIRQPPPSGCGESGAVWETPRTAYQLPTRAGHPGFPSNTAVASPRGQMDLHADHADPTDHTDQREGRPRGLSLGVPSGLAVASSWKGGSGVTR
jgi:hypothetical protein